jgi:3-phenylpropionate/trans-cinnamate dioxygenase ferredoxin reductase subunit
LPLAARLAQQEDSKSRMSDSIVIVGGGHAAAQLCAALAEAGVGARVHVVSEEHAHPYQRPPLSKNFLKNAQEALQLHREQAWYAEKGITLHLGDAVRAIDRAARQVVLASGAVLPYGQLVLATGNRARKLPALDRPLENVLTLRSAADAEAMRARLQREGGGELVVLGGGFIGLEVAATARHLGWQVRVLEALPRLLSRSASPELSAHILQHHRDLGTRVDLGVRVGDFEFEGERLAALRANGERSAVDLLLLGIGAVPETRLAQDAGLQVENGVVVDAALRSSDPDILAIGDCASFERRGARLRLESVQNATDQAKVAARTLLGQDATYDPTPWFWSDQGGLRLQMVGLWRDGLQAVRRPGATPASFSLFHYDGDLLVAVESANAPMDHMMARKLLEQGKSPAREQVADPQVALKSLLA